MLLRLLFVLLIFAQVSAFGQNPTPRPSPIPSPIPSLASGMMVGIGMGGIYSAVDSNSCKNTNEAIEPRAYFIKNNFKERNVESTVNGLQAYMKICKVDPAKYGWGNGTFEAWKNQGYQAELNVLKDRIERQSLVGKISENDRAEYKSFAERLGISDKDISSFLRDESSIAAKNKTSCEKKDLRNETLGPVRDQDSVGWCYAFTAADLLTYKTGKKVSASDISMLNEAGWMKDIGVTVGRSEASYQGGRIEEALDKVKEKGMCLEKDFRSDDMGAGRLKEVVDTVDKAKKQYKKGQILCDTGQAAASELFPNVDMNEYSNILDKTSRAKFMSELQDKSCGQRESLANVEFVHENALFTQEGRKDLTKMIDQQLDKNNISGISYDAGVVVRSEFERSEDFMPHASIVVGRRFNEKSNSCEYLVRNSWGKSCGSYRFPLECEEGNVWIPKEDLLKGLFNVTYIK